MAQPATPLPPLETTLPERLAALLPGEAHGLSGVTSILLSADGLEVIFLGPLATREISVACQQVLRRLRQQLGEGRLTGGFYVRKAEEFEGYKPLSGLL